MYVGVGLNASSEIEALLLQMLYVLVSEISCRYIE